MTVAGTPRTSTAPAVSVRSLDQRPSRVRAAVDLAVRHPVLAVAVVATLARLVMVVLVGPLRPGFLVPDESQYIELAASVARGDGAEAWQPGYGQSLYDSTATFMRPLTALVQVFGAHQIVGQLLSAAAGVLACVLTTLLALRAVRPGYALSAGLVAALLPSQVFWSSVVLRESMTWCAVLALTLSIPLAAAARSRRALIGPFALALASGFALSDLRQQTAFLAVWCLVPAAVLAISRSRATLTAGALVVALVAPLLAGMGLGGFALVEQAVPRLATIRGNLSLGAESSFIDKTVLPPAASPGAERPDATAPPGDSPGGSGGPSGPTTSRPTPAEPPPGAVVLTAPSGEQVFVEDGGAANLSALPRGLLAVAVRPLPWESTPNAGVLLAKVETPVWLLLYALSVVAVVVGWSRRSVLAYPVGVTLGILAVAAVTQGNVGTAFRHRGQVLWALAVLAAVGLQHLADRRQRSGR